MVIEDDADIRDSLVEFLESEGFSAVSAANGREGLDLLAANVHPCLILLDLFMPVLDGAGFLDAIAHDGVRRQTPVVVLSAAPADGRLVRSIRSQVSAFLRKPVDLERILDCVRERCRGRLH